MKHRLGSWTLVLAVLVFGFLPVDGQVAAKKPLTYDAYDGWRSIQFSQLSRDGAWLVYALVPQDGDGELVVRNLKTDAEFRAARGREPVLTADGRYVVFTIAPVKADVDKAKKDKKKPEDQPKNALGIMALADGTVTTVERVKSFKLAEEAGTHVAYLLEPPLKKDEKPAEAKPGEAKEPEKKEPAEKKEPEKKEPEKKEEPKDAKKPKEKKKEPGTDLVIRELATGRTVTLPEVVEYAWGKNGAWLGFAVSSKKPENDGAFAWRAADGTTIALLKGQGHYKSLTLDDKAGQIAFLSDRDDYKAEASPYRLYRWADGQAAAAELVPAAPGLPKGMAVSENGRLRFSKDGAKLFFGYAPAPKPEPEEAPEIVKVDIWSWKDPDLQPMQKSQADQEAKRSYQAVVHLGGGAKKLVPLAGPDLPEIAFSDDDRVALGSSTLPYRRLVSWDQGYADYVLVDLNDGGRKKVLEKFSSSVAISPGGSHLLYYDETDKNWHAYRVSDGKTFNLTAKLGVSFADEDWDTPGDPPAYGSAGWTDGDKSVLLYDEFDVWEVKPDGSGGRNATAGAGRRDSVTYRYLRLDRDQKTIPPAALLPLSAFHRRTRASGFARVSLADAAEPSKVLMLDRSVGGLQKAKNAPVYVFTIQDCDVFPDLWVSGPAFADRRKVSEANPQQGDFLWGKAELLQYANSDGKVLDALLIKPENFDPAKKYPLMVYIYEKLADELHRYRTPGPGTSINFARYVSNGYVILMPDIVYEIGYPGDSAMKCVLPAVAKIVDQGYIDPRRIGIQGHSWGGYQITYMITQTNLFAAVQAGASVSNMTSAYGGIRWGTGMVRQFQYEKTQSRIGAPLFARVLQFIENSPVFWAERVQTPYLSIHNDEDDAVPWYQGIEFFTALRRLGKEAYMFNFNGEKHGLRDRENQKYWTVHQDEFFDHFLLGKPRPAWMDDPVPYAERGTRDVKPLFRKPEPKAPAAGAGR